MVYSKVTIIIMNRVEGTVFDLATLSAQKSGDTGGHVNLPDASI